MNRMQAWLDGVAVFVEAVDAGGFARAAKTVGLALTVVAKSVARLESRLCEHFDWQAI